MAPEVVLFADDFATYSGRWQEAESAKAVVAYRDQALGIRVVSPGVAAWSVPDYRMPPGGFRVQAVVDFHGGADDGLAGLMLDYAADDSFLAVAISRGGDVRVLRHEGNTWLDLALTELPRDPPDTLTGTVVLRVDALDSDLAIFIDDVPAGSLPLEKALSGNVFGVMAKAGRGYVDVSFDDIKVVALALQEEQTP